MVSETFTAFALKTTVVSTRALFQVDLQIWAFTHVLHDLVANNQPTSTYLVFTFENMFQLLWMRLALIDRSFEQLHQKAPAKEML
jgi:hypothetical protein